MTDGYLTRLANKHLNPPEPSFDTAIHLSFSIELDREGWQRYIDEHPEHRGETPAQTLIREAIALWESEGLCGSLVSGRRSG